MSLYYYLKPNGDSVYCQVECSKLHSAHTGHFSAPVTLTASNHSFPTQHLVTGF